MSTPETPAKSASTADWAAYLETMGLTVPEGSTRADMIAAAEAHTAPAVVAPVLVEPEGIEGIEYGDPYAGDPADGAYPARPLDEAQAI